MRRRLADEQLRVLVMLGSPTRFIISGADRSTRALIRRGLLVEREGAIGITADGLRKLASEMDAGRVAAEIERRRLSMSAANG